MEVSSVIVAFHVMINGINTYFLLDATLDLYIKPVEVPCMLQNVALRHGLKPNIALNFVSRYICISTSLLSYTSHTYCTYHCASTSMYTQKYRLAKSYLYQQYVYYFYYCSKVFTHKDIHTELSFPSLLLTCMYIIQLCIGTM